MADLNGFNAEAVEPLSDLSPLPVGDYICVIDDSEVKETRAQDGSRYLMLVLKVIEEGPYKDRTLWARLNLWNKNPKAREIAERELSAVCHAVEVLRPRDSAELHGKPLLVKVSQSKRPDNGEMSNEVKGFKPVSAAQSAPAQAPASQASGPVWSRT